MARFITTFRSGKNWRLSESPHDWRGHSDTETLLAAIDLWGVESTIKKSVGMFAIALWDRKERTLTLVRDRIGEKPLYYGWQNGSFLFGSELGALRAHPEFRAEVDRDVIAMYMRRGYIEAPYSIYERVFKLQPGTYLQLTARDRPGDIPRARNILVFAGSSGTRSVTAFRRQ